MHPACAARTTLAEKRAEAGREDFSDMVAAKAAAQKKKTGEKQGKKGFKF